MDIQITVLVENSDPDKGQKMADAIAEFLHEKMGIDTIAVAAPIKDEPEDWNGEPMDPDDIWTPDDF